MQTHFKRGDAVIIALVLCVALLLLLLPLARSTDGSAVLVISLSDGSETTYALSEDRALTLTGNSHTLTVVIEDGAARVVKSTCPDGVCRMGAISKHGEMLVCAPAGVALTVRSQGGDVDAILG
ncbi:MAG: NusG domain II-containing protein [Clostridia bacterium]|nr:NusG domain II-containing protein [Clostridia bacterium]